MSIDFDSLIREIPREKPLSEYNLTREVSFPRSGNNEIILDKHLPEPKSLREEIHEFSGCIISIIPIDDRYLGCRIILGRDAAK